MRVGKLEQEWYKPSGKDFQEELDKIHLVRYRAMEVLCEGATVIDCGTGAGYGAYAVAATAESVLGVDVDPEAIQWAQMLYEDDNLEYRCCDFREVEEKFDIALLDLKMPGMDGSEVLRVLKKEHEFLEVVILTGHGSLDSAVELTKLGAFGYLPKPYELDKLLDTLQQAYEARLKKKFSADEAKMKAIVDAGLGDSPLGILRKLRDLDDGRR